jgi:hypothetical protein
MGLSPLATKYHTAWLDATDPQRIAICSRLGLTYTSREDDHLLNKVAERQQGEYDRIRLASQITPDEQKSSMVLKNNKRKVKITA